MKSRQIVELELERALENLFINDPLRSTVHRNKAGHHVANIGEDASVWVQPLQADADDTLSDAIKACARFITRNRKAGDHGAWAFKAKPCYNDPELSTSFVLMAGIARPSGESLQTQTNQPKISTCVPFWGALSGRGRYMPLSTDGADCDPGEGSAVRLKRQPHLRIYCAIVFCLVTFLGASIAIYLPKSSTSAALIWNEDGYIRYPTPGSVGPKHQARIYYSNASQWSLSNPHDNGQWRIRLDDQALIPAAAWDEEEDRFQAWYHARYPEMSDVIRTKKFLRPSWLGSPDILVRWDKEFHFAHCVLTMRRYWKAKETGRHVCPRDVDFNHIKHCLNWFEGIAFTNDDESVIPEMGNTMIWQTKICF